MAGEVHLAVIECGEHERRQVHSGKVWFVSREREQVCNLPGMMFSKKNIYLFDRQSYRESRRNRKFFHLLVHFPNDWLHMAFCHGRRRLRLLDHGATGTQPFISEAPSLIQPIGALLMESPPPSQCAIKKAMRCQAIGNGSSAWWVSPG